MTWKPVVHTMDNDIPELLAAQRRRASLDYQPGAALARFRGEPTVTPASNDQDSLRRSGIPENTWGRRLEPVERAGCERPRAWKARCVREGGVGVHPGNRIAFDCLAGWRPAHGSLWLEGAIGVGKTLMASAKAQEVLAGSPVLWTSEGALQHDVERNKRHNERRGTQSPVDQAIEAPLLVLDDYLCGRKSKMFSAEQRDELWDYILNQRYEALRPTIFTSNSPLAAVAAKRSARLGSRLWEMCSGDSVVVGGHDWRHA